MVGERRINNGVGVVVKVYWLQEEGVGGRVTRQDVAKKKKKTTSLPYIRNNKQIAALSGYFCQQSSAFLTSRGVSSPQGRKGKWGYNL